MAIYSRMRDLLAANLKLTGEELEQWNEITEDLDDIDLALGGWITVMNTVLSEPIEVQIEPL